MRFFALVSDIALNKVNLFNGDKNYVFVCVFQLDVVPFVSHGFDTLDSLKLTDTVIYMNYKVTFV